ncbi:helix-turn-helix domain-containing protein [Hymenobacter sp. GOD-10R]|uniref:helix-turn-helix domain-containing protein n=1 Tax=Hymenobacter sp. GOD-10R TaxID=3093922 RepID=UPI002D7A2448|nr:helix-turn-helix domain-containing protein [Hymenobacter sp. GOD-10R]WRQ26919.1 helix-turn-helix domain-containing protein [Hymenobacter sp. GOD-10R]
MQHLKVGSAEAIQDTVKGFWYTSIDFSELPAGFEVIPDGFAEIVFHFGSPCSISTPDGLQPLPSPFLMGLLGQPVLLHAQNRLEVIGVKCFPWTVFELLGLPAGKDGVRVFEHPIAQLQAPLAELIRAGKVAEALAQVQQYFLSAPMGVAADQLLAKAGVAMSEANGTLPVSQVAAAAHATVRTLERKFKQAAGHTVKDVSGLMRFEQARNHLWLEPTANLAGLALELGYTDQAHLSREFKRYSGTTPAAFARTAKHRQQTASHDFVAFVQS